MSPEVSDLVVEIPEKKVRKRRRAPSTRVPLRELKRKRKLSLVEIESLTDGQGRFKIYKNKEKNNINLIRSFVSGVRNVQDPEVRSKYVHKHHERAARSECLRMVYVDDDGEPLEFKDSEVILPLNGRHASRQPGAAKKRADTILKFLHKNTNHGTDRYKKPGQDGNQNGKYGPNILRDFGFGLASGCEFYEKYVAPVKDLQQVIDPEKAEAAPKDVEVPMQE